MITSKDLTCRYCVYSFEYNNGHTECRQSPDFKNGVCSIDYWCGQGLWIGQRSGFPNWEITRDVIIKVEEMDGRLKDPREE